MYTPVFAGAKGDDLIGFFSINCHWIDIGGSAIGSVSYSSTDIFMEGLQLRSIKILSKGEPIEEVYRIIENNTRFPLELLGDIEAQLGGCLLGRDLTQAMADKYGIKVFFEALETILDQCEAATREKIRAIPDGVYQHEAFLDNDGVRDEKIPIRVKVIIAGDEMTVDFSEMSDQVKGCINSGFYGGGRTCVRVAFKYLIATDEPANEGTFRPVKMILAGRQVDQRRGDRGDGALQHSFPDGHRLHHQSAGAGVARARHRRALRDFFIAELCRQTHGYRRGVQSQRQRPRRLGRMRNP